jgi:hypothetical protein
MPKFYPTIPTNSKKGRKKGEVDFIIYDPQFGILFLEVKGGGIRTDRQ